MFTYFLAWVGALIFLLMGLICGLFLILSEDDLYHDTGSTFLKALQILRIILMLPLGLICFAVAFSADNFDLLFFKFTPMAACGLLFLELLAGVILCGFDEMSHFLEDYLSAALAYMFMGLFLFLSAQCVRARADFRQEHSQAKVVRYVEQSDHRVYFDDGTFVKTTSDQISEGDTLRVFKNKPLH